MTGREMKLSYCLVIIAFVGLGSFLGFAAFVDLLL